jgi:serine phosphatase RsbU (regulator of sigma subunit)
MQRDYLTTMVQELEKSQNEVVEKNKLLEKTSKTLHEAFINIKSSINYAKRIQDAMLPNKGLLERFFQDSFIFFKPKDVVSGDFYWYTMAGNKIIVAAVDCTGHGVPGAFMSMLGMELLHHVVNVQRFDSPDEILNQLHNNIRRVLKQEKGENRDGMDIALLVIDKKNKVMEFAGAHNPLIWIQDNEMHHIKADRQAIGGFQREPNKNFTKQIIHYKEGAVFYLFSDGYQDLCHGKTGKRFMSSKFRTLLHEIHQKPMHKQEKILNNVKKYWIKKDSQQLDDILVIGIKV